MAAPPAWRRDILDNAVGDWASGELDEADLEAERQFYTLRWDTHPGTPASEIFAAAERAAVEAARERGNFRPLEELLQPKHPMNLRAGDVFSYVDDSGVVKRGRVGKAFGKRPIRESLGAGTYELISDDIARRRKRPNRRPPMSKDELHATNPAYGAADEIPRIELILRDGYFEKDGKLIHDQAVHTAARRHLGEFRKIEKYKNIDDDRLRELLIRHLSKHRPKKQKRKSKPKR